MLLLVQPVAAGRTRGSILAQPQADLSGLQLGLEHTAAAQPPVQLSPAGQYAMRSQLVILHCIL